MASSKVKFEMVPVDQLVLDTNNPRIAKWLEMYRGDVGEAAMKLALVAGGRDSDVAGPSYTSLKQSIRTNGGVIHPVIVNKEPNGRLLVVEGNTRTVIYREFKLPGDDGRWDKIPAMIYEDMSQELIDAIRLQAHLVGAREWDPYSKAWYLNKLRNDLHLPFAQVVDFCGGDAREVEKLISAYNRSKMFARSKARKGPAE
jgi:ParB-like chromosome segregation protein Spo0J